LGATKATGRAVAPVLARVEHEELDEIAEAERTIELEVCAAREGLAAERRVLIEGLISGGAALQEGRRGSLFSERAPV
jgi:hypothetical protein